MRALGFVAAWVGYLADLGVSDRFPARSGRRRRGPRVIRCGAACSARCPARRGRNSPGSRGFMQRRRQICACVYGRSCAWLRGWTVDLDLRALTCERVALLLCRAFAPWQKGGWVRVTSREWVVWTLAGIWG